MKRMENKLLNKIKDIDTLTEQITEWKLQGNRIVFTNGVFDIMHRGHVLYLIKASELADKLVIGLNSDNSVRHVKGVGRPIIDQKSRAIVLAGLFCVDAVIIFEENTPFNIISKIRPDILVKGADYQLTEIVGAKTVAAYGGEVKTIEFIEGYSSSLIMQKIRNP